MATQGEGVRSPWASIWLSPRETIEGIVTTQPRRLVWLLAGLGAIASFYTEFLSLGLVDSFGWRLWLAFVVGSAIIGILFLYVNALILRAMGGLLDGPASTLELRAVLAWSSLPGIVGLAIALTLNVLAEPLSGAAGVSPTVISQVATVVAALFGFWSFVVVLLMLSRVQGFGFWRTITAYCAVLLFPVLIALFVRTFLFQPFSLPSGSMYPTLAVGDNVFVSKFAYGYSRYSLPFSPSWLSGRVFGAEPVRGDVVVFILPKDGVTTYAKRVVGMPGDRIQMQQGALYINGAAVRRERVEDLVGDNACGAEPTAKVKRWRETLPNGVSYQTLDCIDAGFYDNTNVYVVPAGHFFMLGDNRDNSTDSRVLSAMGYIPLNNVIGRVEMVYFSNGPDKDDGTPRVRSERVGLMIR
ncbi:MAG: signal peptidase I [Bradyrhizobium sp.]|uniref:signal peptidase I n=1 Tax=Bradyrhizobium sp. TaxID=376 RepID=UPI0025C1D402|nr:signal peptidase I [Bradyrhizobium sp.]MBI5262469.1 signal peptidase I [Bradyrhizobium sp.]